MTRKLIGLTGFIGSGKSTVGNYLVTNYGFKPASFASSLKDAASSIFRWPRDLLEGDTKESREWREIPDKFWSKKLERDITPRWILQHLGTDVLRNNFIDSIWIWSLEKHLGESTDNIVITDVRFQNEVKLITESGGMLLWIQRGLMPVWYNDYIVDPTIMPIKYPTIHSSEFSWVGQGNIDIIDNNSDLQNLYKQVDMYV